jgi:hypothetical protein
MRPRLLRCALLTGLAACGDPPAAATTAQPDTDASTSGAGTSTTSTTAADPTTSTTADLTSGTGSAGGSTSTTTSPTSTSTSTSTSADTTAALTTGESTSTTSTTGESSTGTPQGPLLTLQHAQFKGTHNSYHVEPALPFDASHEYTHAPLDVQLAAQGVRAFELDVHKGLGDFEVFHISVIDAVSTCPTVQACLGVIRTWSDAHPAHLPIVVWFEIKDSTGGLPIDGGDLDELDDVVRGVLPPDKLFTPDDLQGAHASVREALDTDGWPLLDAVRGRILLVLLNVDDAHAENYTDGYTTLAGRAMFARATPDQFTASWAAIAKLGVDETDAITQAHAARMLIATNVCSAGDDDADCTEALSDAKAAGIHMLKDDFPAPVDGMTYFSDFPDGNPARCNPVTAPPECTSEALEDL